MKERPYRCANYTYACLFVSTYTTHTFNSYMDVSNVWLKRDVVHKLVMYICLMQSTATYISRAGSQYHPVCSGKLRRPLIKPDQNFPDNIDNAQENHFSCFLSNLMQMLLFFFFSFIKLYLHHRVINLCLSNNDSLGGSVTQNLSIITLLFFTIHFVFVNYIFFFFF